MRVSGVDECGATGAQLRMSANDWWRTCAPVGGAWPRPLKAERVGIGGYSCVVAAAIHSSGPDDGGAEPADAVSSAGGGLLAALDADDSVAAVEEGEVGRVRVGCVKGALRVVSSDWGRA